MKTAWIFVAHGSRESEAQAAFGDMIAQVAATQPQVRVVPAFFSLGEPDLVTQVARLVEDGVRRIAIVPVFLLDGVHVRRDIPSQVETLRHRWPEVEFHLEPSLQDDAGLVRLLAARITA